MIKGVLVKCHKFVFIVYFHRIKCLRVSYGKNVLEIHLNNNWNVGDYNLNFSEERQTEIKTCLEDISQDTSCDISSRHTSMINLFQGIYIYIRVDWQFQRANWSVNLFWGSSSCLNCSMILLSVSMIIGRHIYSSVLSTNFRASGGLIPSCHLNMIHLKLLSHDVRNFI